jgi:hypothetical protein
MPQAKKDFKAKARGASAKAGKISRKRIEELEAAARENRALRRAARAAAADGAAAPDPDPQPDYDEDDADMQDPQLAADLPEAAQVMGAMAAGELEPPPLPNAAEVGAIVGGRPIVARANEANDTAFWQEARQDLMERGGARGETRNFKYSERFQELAMFLLLTANATLRVMKGRAGGSINRAKPRYNPFKHLVAKVRAMAWGRLWMMGVIRRRLQQDGGAFGPWDFKDANGMHRTRVKHNREYAWSGTPEGVARYGVNANQASAEQLQNRLDDGVTGYGGYFGSRLGRAIGSRFGLGDEAARLASNAENWALRKASDKYMAGHGGFFSQIGQGFEQMGDDIANVAGDAYRGVTGNPVGRAFIDNAIQAAGDGLADGFGAYDGFNPADDVGTANNQMAEDAMAGMANRRASTLKRARKDMGLGDEEAPMLVPANFEDARATYWNSLINPDKQSFHTNLQQITMPDETGNLCVVHREFIQDVVVPGAAGTTPSSFQSLIELDVNAGLKAVFPAGCNVAKLYQTWRPIKMIFEFRSLVTQGNSTASGSVEMVSITNPYQAYYADKRQMSNATGAISGIITSNLMLGVECQPSKSPISSTGLFVRSDILPSGVEVDTFDKCRIQLAASGAQPGSTCGELYVYYMWELGGFIGDVISPLQVGEGISLGLNTSSSWVSAPVNGTGVNGASMPVPSIAGYMFGFNGRFPKVAAPAITLGVPVAMPFQSAWSFSTLAGAVAEPGVPVIIRQSVIGANASAAAIAPSVNPPIAPSTGYFAPIANWTQSTNVIASYGVSAEYTTAYTNTYNVASTQTWTDPIQTLKFYAVPGATYLFEFCYQAYQLGGTTAAAGGNPLSTFGATDVAFWANYLTPQWGQVAYNITGGNLVSTADNSKKGSMSILPVANPVYNNGSLVAGTTSWANIPLLGAISFKCSTTTSSQAVISFTPTGGTFPVASGGNTGGTLVYATQMSYSFTRTK